MAKLNPNQSIGNPTGAVGELVYAKQPDGRVIIRRRPGPESAQTPGEKANQSRFRLAVAYRQSVVSDPDKCAPYKTAARILRKRACDLALADFLKAPVIQNVDVANYTGKAAEMIGIDVADDFEVTSVEVLIRLLNGMPVEEGAAVRKSECQWVYWTRSSVAPGQALTIEVMAADRAGNVVIKSLDHVLRAV